MVALIPKQDTPAVKRWLSMSTDRRNLENNQMGYQLTDAKWTLYHVFTGPDDNYTVNRRWVKAQCAKAQRTWTIPNWEMMIKQ